MLRKRKRNLLMAKPRSKMHLSRVVLKTLPSASSFRSRPTVTNWVPRSNATQLKTQIATITTGRKATEWVSAGPFLCTERVTMPVWNRAWRAPDGPLATSWILVARLASSSCLKRASRSSTESFKCRKLRLTAIAIEFKFSRNHRTVASWSPRHQTILWRSKIQKTSWKSRNQVTICKSRRRQRCKSLKKRSKNQAS